MWKETQTANKKYTPHFVLLVLGNGNTFNRGKSLRLCSSVSIKILYRSFSHDLYFTSTVTCSSYDEYCTCCTEICAIFFTWYWVWLYCKNIAAIRHNKMYHPQSFPFQLLTSKQIELPWTTTNYHDCHELPWTAMTTIKYHELPWTSMTAMS